MASWQGEGKASLQKGMRGALKSHFLSNMQTQKAATTNYHLLWHVSRSSRCTAGQNPTLIMQCPPTSEFHLQLIFHVLYIKCIDQGYWHRTTDAFRPRPHAFEVYDPIQIGFIISHHIIWTKGRILLTKTVHCKETKLHIASKFLPSFNFLNQCRLTAKPPGSAICQRCFLPPFFVLKWSYLGSKDLINTKRSKMAVTKQQPLPDWSAWLSTAFQCHNGNTLFRMPQTALVKAEAMLKPVNLRMLWC